MPTVVPEARKALAEGCAVVIGLQTTGEAAADAMGLEPGQACGWVSTTREILRRFVTVHFPTLRETAKGGEHSHFADVCDTIPLNFAGAWLWYEAQPCMWLPGILRQHMW